MKEKLERFFLHWSIEDKMWKAVGVGEEKTFENGRLFKMNDTNRQTGRTLGMLMNARAVADREPKGSRVLVIVRDAPAINYCKSMLAEKGINSEGIAFFMVVNASARMFSLKGLDFAAIFADHAAFEGCFAVDGQAVKEYIDNWTYRPLTTAIAASPKIEDNQNVVSLPCDLKKGHFHVAPLGKLDANQGRCSHRFRRLVQEDAIQCSGPECGLKISGQHLDALGPHVYDHARTKLADECGTMAKEISGLKIQIFDLQRENDNLRRKVKK